MPTELRLYESAPPVVLELDDTAAHALAGSGVVAVVPCGPGTWELRAARKVGVVSLGDLTVWIHPKIAIRQLFWLLGWARRPGWTPSEDVEYAPDEELVPVIAEAFASQAERALETGLLQGYLEVDAAEPVLRGRLRAAEQLRRRHGLAVPLLVRYDDYGPDIIENQLLRAATSSLLRIPGVEGSVRSRLRALRGLLADVSDLPVRAPHRRWLPTRLNARYHNALWLAEIVLASHAVDHLPGGVRLEGFLVDLYQVFEDFVTSTLSTELERQAGGACHKQDEFTLDDGGDIDIRPDLVWRLDGNPAAVVDAKYKAERPSGFPQADLYQGLAYATAYGLSTAHLVYAKGNESEQTWKVRKSRVSITAHSLDLSSPPPKVLEQVERLAALIAKQGLRDVMFGSASLTAPPPRGDLSGRPT
ncbi:MAG TPA: hypothetical protein VGS21_02360 [Acidimicrobiales bacterium]|nr:hypothetical protein [Acidimicrobiales bacterium]